ncbi:phage virion morphogenesis protein [Aurantimonas sp. 22II-16-19i]|uniref:phage virion morphogenesis protein n=1 Tax=Aurantimonas sp. 22II-16-19i TaxID=1317114 RepID=UPI0009F7C653|nr:phage virion morphogenesis protein [Aurantimonas sp. 22II-16-19i]ORE85737.1 Mu-like prophage protein [Aurantimonas sp. 22II-16-19i]
MAAEGIRITVDDSAVLAALSRLEQRDRSDAMHAIGAYLVTSTQQRFERESGPDGRPWQRLSPRTANKRIGKTRRGYDHMLRVKNRLYSSISYQADASSTAVGTNVAYAAIQHLGGVIKQAARRQTIYQRYDPKADTLDQRFVKRSRSNFARDVDVAAHEINIPARPYLGISDEDRAEILEIVADTERRSLPGGGR